MTGNNNRRYLPTSSSCFVCGEDNHAGLRSRFYVEDNLVKARLRAEPHHCGYPKVVHGGVVAAILDETMAWAAARATERMCVTGDLTVRYAKRVPSDRDLWVSAEVVRFNRRVAQVRAKLADEAGEVYALAEGRFAPVSTEETLRVDDALNYRGAEERVFDRLRKKEGWIVDSE